MLDAESRELLLARRAGTGPRRRLCPDQRRSGHRQERGAAPAGRTPGATARSDRRRHRPPQRQPGRLLPRDGRSVRRRAATHNRWGGFKALRERWLAHLDSTLLRPVLLIDEAQEMLPAVLNELRLLASAQFDSRHLLSVVFAGDGRFNTKLRREELLPLGSRIRTRLIMEYASREELRACLKHLLDSAGNASLMTPELINALVRSRRRQLPRADRHGRRTARHRRPTGTHPARRKALSRTLCQHERESPQSPLNPTRRLPMKPPPFADRRCPGAFR